MISRATLVPTFETFTDRARRVLVLSQEEARVLNHPFIGTEHILLGLISEGHGVAAQALQRLDVSLPKARETVKELMSVSRQSHLSSPPPVGSPPFTPRAKKVLELSLREALQLGHNYIGTEHMLLGIVREGEGFGARALTILGAETPKVRQQVMNLLAARHRGETERAGISDKVKQPLIVKTERAGSMLSVKSRSTQIGIGWTASVVRLGRRPADYAAACEELAELAGVHRLDLLGQVVVRSIDTHQGPALELSVSQAVEDERDSATER